MSDKEKLREVLDSASASLVALYPAIRARHFMVGVRAKGGLYGDDMYHLIIHAEGAIKGVIAAAKLLQEKDKV